MGVGISWDELVGNVVKEGVLGVILVVGIGYYKNMCFVERIVVKKFFEVLNFYFKKVLNEIFVNVRKICGNNFLGVNILYVINDYGCVLRDFCEVGVNIIIIGVGLFINMFEFVKDFSDVAFIFIIFLVKVLKIFCKRWSDCYKRILDVFIVEGFLSGGY